jgi:hypothetical protein
MFDLSSLLADRPERSAISAPGMRLIGVLALLVATITVAEAQTVCQVHLELPDSYASLVRPGIDDPPVRVVVPPNDPPRFADPTASFHGQILLGEDLLYHLPMFMDDPANHPHNFQVVMRVEVPPDFAGKLRSSRESHKDALYTVKPPVFAQRRLFDFPGHPHLSAFEAVEVVRHHFERRDPPPEPLFKAPMAIREIVHFRHLAPGREKPEELAYMLLRSGDETYLAKLLSAPPDFDHILKVRIDGEAPNETAYVVLGDRENDQAARLRVGENLECSGDGLHVSLIIVSEVYCEAGELSQVFNTGFAQESCPKN